MIYVTLNVTWLLGPDEPPQLPHLNPIIATLGFSETEDLYHRFTANKSVATVEKLLKKNGPKYLKNVSDLLFSLCNKS